MDQQLIILLVATGVLALLIGWLLGRNTGRKANLLEHEAELAEKDSAYQVLQKEHTHKAQLLSALQQKLAELERIQAGYDQELNQWKTTAESNTSKWEVVNRNYAMVSTEFQAYKSATNTQLSELARINQGLEAHIKATREDMLGRDAKLAALSQENAGLSNEIETARREIDRLQAVCEQLGGELQTTLAALAGERETTARLQEEQADAQIAGEKALGEARAEIDGLRTEAAELESRLRSKAENLAETETQLDALRAQHKELEENYAFLQEEESLAVQNLENLEAEYTAVATDLQQLKSTMALRMRERREFVAANDELRERNERLTAELQTLNNRYEMEIGSTLDDLEAYKQRISQLHTELQNNRVAIANLEAENERLRSQHTGAIAVAPSSAKEPEAAIFERLRARAQDLDFTRIGSAAPGERDDLEAIKGLGPFTVRLLNALGIHTYRQLAALNDRDVDWVNEAIEFIPGRIRRDNWVGQARALLGLTETAVPEAPSEEDLTLIEGIGAKIKDLLYKNGIRNFKQLSESSPESLKAILDAAGKRYQMHDPGSWPRQAALAAGGDLEGLKVLQAELVGGR